MPGVVRGRRRRCGGWASGNSSAASAKQQSDPRTTCFHGREPRGERSTPPTHRCTCCATACVDRRNLPVCRWPCKRRRCGAATRSTSAPPRLSTGQHTLSPIQAPAAPRQRLRPVQGAAAPPSPDQPESNTRANGKSGGGSHTIPESPCDNGHAACPGCAERADGAACGRRFGACQQQPAIRSHHHHHRHSNKLAATQRSTAAGGVCRRRLHGGGACYHANGQRHARLPPQQHTCHPGLQRPPQDRALC